MTTSTGAILSALAAMFVLASCQPDDQTDSETHWQRALHACDQDSECGEGLDCHCGMCTRPCASEELACSSISGSATCVEDPGAVATLCAADSDAPASLCAVACTDATDCPDEQACRIGHCTPVDSTAMDGGTDTDTDVGDTVEDTDTGSRIPAEYRCGEPDNPNCCTADFYPARNDMRQVPEFAGTFESASFELFRGQSAVQVTFEGVVDATLQDVPCPPNPTARNVWCQVDYAMSFDNGDLRIFLGLPRQTLESLATPGDTLTIEGHIADGAVESMLLTASDGSVLIDMESTFEDLRGGQNVTLEKTRDDYTLTLPEPGDDFGNAECLHGPDECDRIYAVMPLALEHSQQSVPVPVDANENFSVNGSDYTLRHFVSYERIGLPESCADITPPRMNYVVVRQTP